jgi:hypothetical protein
MSMDLTAALQRKAKAEPDSDSDVAIATIWLAFNLLMIIGALFVCEGLWVPLALFAAVCCGWAVLGWRRQTKAEGLTKSRAPYIVAPGRKRSNAYRKAALEHVADAGTTTPLAGR